MHTRTHTCTHAHTHAQTHTHAHVHTHTHTHKQHNIESPDPGPNNITMETRLPEIEGELSPTSPSDSQRSFHERAL